MAPFLLDFKFVSIFGKWKEKESLASQLSYTLREALNVRDALKCMFLDPV